MPWSDGLGKGGLGKLGAPQPTLLAGFVRQQNNGLVVLAVDALCFEERRTSRAGIAPSPDADWLQHYNQMCYRLLRGDTLMRRVLEHRRYSGGHALTQERFEDIVKWIVAACRE